MSPMSLMCPMSPIWLFELSQKPSPYLWIPSASPWGGVVAQINTFSTAINASVTKFNGLCNAQKPNV